MIDGLDDRVTAKPLPFLRRLGGSDESLMQVWRQVSKQIPWVFLIIVALPTVVTAIYMFLIAAPLYVSESNFVVRTHSQGGPSAFGAVLASVGVNLGASASDAYEINEYMMSRSAVQDLASHQDLRNVLNRPESDFIARYPRFYENDSFENLFKSYPRFVSVSYDSTTGISTLSVSAFRADDAYKIADALLAGAEKLLNQLNERAADDGIEQAWVQVQTAQKRAVAVELALTNFRTREKLIDPTQASAAGTSIVNELNTQLATMQAQRNSLAALAPQSPALPDLDQRIQSLQAEQQLQRAKIAGESNSLAPLIGEYERLLLDRDYAARSLETADSVLEQAQIDARKKQTYLERVAGPNIPDQAEMPRRTRSVLIVFISALVTYTIIMLVIAGLREHRQL
jgi:capsular polysaccharide transport system permease protein